MTNTRFTEFIEFFPPLDTPFSLLPDLGQIPTVSLPLPDVLMEAFIFPFEGEEMDEYTEFMPWGRIAGTEDFHALIYWKAGVMRYEFILATYKPDGTPINHAIVGGLTFDDENTLHSVAVIQDDLSITIAEAVARGHEDSLDPDQTNTYQMKIDKLGIISYGAKDED